MPKQNSYLKLWEKATQDLTANFIVKYFGKDVSDIWWVGDAIGDVLHINDYFFDLNQMVDFIRYNYSVEDTFAYYDYALDCGYKDISPINIKNWRELKNDKT